MTTIRENIERLRSKQRLGQDNLSRKIALKYFTLARIEGDLVKKPGAQMVKKITTVLRIFIKDLLKSQIVMICSQTIAI
jgi:predicted transcriptional regulator